MHTCRTALFTICHPELLTSYVQFTDQCKFDYVVKRMIKNNDDFISDRELEDEVIVVRNPISYYSLKAAVQRYN